MNRRQTLIIAILFVASLAVGVLFQLSRRVLSSAEVEPVRYTGLQGAASIPWLPSQPSDYGDRVSASVASGRLPFPLPRIGYLPDAATITDIYVAPVSTPAEYRYVIMIASNGIMIEAGVTTNQVGWDSVLSEPGTPFKTVSVHSIPALAAEPGDEVLGEGHVWHRPGSIMWQRESILFTIYGEYSVQELVKIAESVQ